MEELSGTAGQACGMGIAINDAGKIVSAVSAPRGSFASAWPTAMNDSGQVAVTDWHGSTVSAFLYADSTGLQALPTPHGEMAFTHGIAVNGDVLGGFAIEPGVLRAARWRTGAGGHVAQNLNDLLPPNSGWVLERARAANAHSIAGTGTLNGQARGFLMDQQSGSIRDLGAVVPAGGAIFTAAINAANVMVGSLRTDRERAFVATDDRGVEWLEELIAPGTGWTILSASALNDAGQIVGRAQHDGQVHGVLIVPR